jgi:hypothetical protein
MGERVIRIDTKGLAVNQGAWTASVMWMDARWNNDEAIVFDSGGSSDPGIYTNPGNAENYPVAGNATTATGNVINGFITFRIGLKSAYTPTDKYPARYAVVLLSYANNARRQKIFLRQGEDADYLMMTGDPVVIDNKLTWRTKCAMIMPRNLTATTLDASVAVRGGKFTDYPTQTGAFFNYANPGHPSNPGGTGLRFAWNPYTSTASGWNSTFYDGGFWYNISKNYELAPPGYRRISDGHINQYDAFPEVSRSELRQSLFRNPVSGFYDVGETSNSVWGYYADGFFDRRSIASGTTVAGGTRDVAHIGRLFFNPIPVSGRYNASLFFPAGGFRDNNSTGTLNGSGIWGMYWTATLKAGSEVMIIGMSDSKATSYYYSPARGMTVRCVKE